jgi:hypothetical protein
VAATEVTAEAVAAVPAGEARSEAVRGRGGKNIPPEPHHLRIPTTVSPFFFDIAKQFVLVLCL